MTHPAARSIDEYLKQLRTALAGEDPALIQDALYDAEEYLRAELASHEGKSEADALELVASTYGAPEEVAAAYRETEIKVNAALHTPRLRPRTTAPGALSRYFGVFSDPQAYTSLLFMLLSLITGVLYFTFTVTGLALSLGLSVLVIGLPFFLAFIGMARVIAVGEGRLLEAVTGERMPRRPAHPGPAANFFARVGQMLKDPRTWTTLAYCLLMLPLGILYFTVAITLFAVGLAFVALPFVKLWDILADHNDWTRYVNLGVDVLDNWVGYLLVCVCGIFILPALMYLARGITRIHCRLAKELLVTPAG